MEKRSKKIETHETHESILDEIEATNSATRGPSEGKVTRQQSKRIPAKHNTVPAYTCFYKNHLFYISQRKEDNCMQTTPISPYFFLYRMTPKYLYFDRNFLNSYLSVKPT